MSDRLDLHAVDPTATDDWDQIRSGLRAAARSALRDARRHRTERRWALVSLAAAAGVAGLLFTMREAPTAAVAGPPAWLELPAPMSRLTEETSPDALTIYMAFKGSR